MPDIPEEPLKPELKVTRFELVKTDAATGEVFEVLEGGDGKPTVATFRRPGQPPGSYADVPYQPACRSGIADRPKEIET